jgi:Domain of unknown function (DUF4347)
MANRVHFWSDVKGDTFHASTRGSAEPHAEEGHDGAIQVTSLVQLHSIFRAVLKNNDVFDEIDFHTHGSPGVVYIWADQLTWGAPLKPFENQGFERIFKPNATITFNGCNVGEGGNGEYFLTEVARVFLKTGGTVKGNTGLGNGLIRSVWHPFGKWVTATATPGGAVSLAGHTNLIPRVLNERIEKMVLSLEDLERRNKPYDLRAAKDSVGRAVPFVTPPAGSSWANLHDACYYLDKAEEDVRKEQNRIMWDPQSPEPARLPSGGWKKD